MDTTSITMITSGITIILFSGFLLWMRKQGKPKENVGARPDGDLPSLIVRAAPAITATASHSDSNSPPSNALDGNPATRWSSGVYMQPGMWFQLDLGSVNVTEGVLLNHMPSKDDHPEQWSIAVSPDGQDWQTVVLGNGIIDAIWQPVNARYIKTTCDKPYGGWWWSIHEASVMYHALPPVIEPPPTPQPTPIPVPADETEARAQVGKWALQYGWEGHSFTNIDFMKNTIITMEGYSWLKVDDDE